MQCLNLQTVMYSIVLRHVDRHGRQEAADMHTPMRTGGQEIAGSWSGDKHTQQHRRVPSAVGSLEWQYRAAGAVPEERRRPARLQHLGKCWQACWLDSSPLCSASGGDLSTDHRATGFQMQRLVALDPR